MGVREIHGALTQPEFFKLFQQFGRSIRQSVGSDLMLRQAVQTVGTGCKLDRCAVLVLDSNRQEVAVVAEYHLESLSPLNGRRYQLWLNSQGYRLLSEGKPVPLKEIQLESGQLNEPPTLDQFIRDSQSTAVVAFPLLTNSRLLGFLSMHFCQESGSFSEQLLEVGEALAEELALGIAQSQLLDEKDLEARVFRDAALPFLVFDPNSYRILELNDACQHLLSGSGANLKNSSLLELLPSSDGTRIKESASSIGPSKTVVSITGIVARGSNGPLAVDAFVSSLNLNGRPALLLTLLPLSEETQASSLLSAQGSQDSSAKFEELVATLSKQLNWERLARHIISTLHASLDRDTVLQTTVDSLGRALGVSCCLVVRTDIPVSPVVTHEYVRSDLSPLGLGRTSQFPQSALSLFKYKGTAIADLASDVRPGGLTDQDLEELLENNIRALMGAPIAYHGVAHGALILIQTDRPRKWNPQEVELVEAVVEQAAIALNHAQNYNQIKDQLFNMNLLGNLTQQLTNVLDAASRNARQEQLSETPKQPGPATPLSLREMEVLKLIASGLANREIAQRLFLTESTVELHASRIRKKLKLKSRTALVKYACDNHLV